MSLSQRPDTLTGKQTNKQSRDIWKKNENPITSAAGLYVCRGGGVGLGEGSSELVRSEVLQMPDRGSLDDSGIVKQA